MGQGSVGSWQLAVGDEASLIADEGARVPGGDELGEQVVAVRTAEGILDLSSRADIAGVAKYLSN